MPSDSSKNYRRSIRLQEYDYTQAGAYFLTICADERKSMFGKIVDGEIKLNQVGEAVKDEWLKTSAIRENVELDEYVIMPNHFHAILWILEGRGTARRAPTFEQFGKPVAGSVPTIVRSFKSAVTKSTNNIRRHSSLVWQRNYYEHVVRNEADLNRIREYIIFNPVRWQFDRDNPDGKPDRIEEEFWENLKPIVEFDRVYEPIIKKETL